LNKKRPMIEQSLERMKNDRIPELAWNYKP
jgi:hypothetical protein